MTTVYLKIHHCLTSRCRGINANFTLQCSSQFSLPEYAKRSDVPTSFSVGKYFVDCSIQKIDLEENNY